MIHYYHVHGRTLVVRLWPWPAVRWTWPIKSREDSTVWIGARTTQVGFESRPGPGLPRWSESAHDQLWRVR